MDSRLAICFLTFACTFSSSCFRSVESRPFFIIGSSYVDTGNVSPSDINRPFPWRNPYGSSWPGLPAGRYSNGKVFTDLISAAMNFTTPTLFRQRLTWRKYDTGMNFAVGGSGVLSAYGYPNSSAQIDSLESIIASYNQTERASAFVLYTTAGEDYFHALTVQKTPVSEVYPLTISVGKQIAADLIRLYALDLRNFAVTTLPPIGCHPIATAVNNFRICNDDWSTTVANVHNARVWKNLNGLKNYFKNSTVTILDLYSAFRNALADASFASNNQRLAPCCAGWTGSTMNTKNTCGSVDSSGNPQYAACGNPSAKFYWDDSFHPTEAGWQAILKLLTPSLPILKN